MHVILAIAIAVAANGSSPERSSAGAEVQPAVQSVFNRMDRDGNGFITANEAPRVSRARQAGPAAPSSASSGAQLWIQTYDRDGDSRVSVPEYIAGQSPG
jgi:hypothetical protein